MAQINYELRITDEFEVNLGEGFDGAVGEKVTRWEDTEFSPVFLIFTRNEKDLSLVVAVHDLAVRVNRSVAINACEDKNPDHQVFPVKSE